MKKMYGWATLNKKAFTLIELLAVIVILAIIALIATPIILGIIGDTKQEAKERSKENYLTAAKQAVLKYQMNNSQVEINGKCKINKSGHLKCNGIETPIIVEVDGEKPVRGNIVFENGKIVSSTIKFNGEQVEPNDCIYGGELAVGTQYQTEQYTYTYKQGLNQSFALEEFPEDGWSVRLTNPNSTDPVNEKICTTIDGKPIVNMVGTFVNSKATKIDLSSFDTSKVTTMKGMFAMSSATELDLSSFDTSNVVDMSDMFNASSVENVDLSNFDTSNVINMERMFLQSKAIEIDLSEINTSNVINMSQMFDQSSATTLDLSKFNTSKVTDMTNMFFLSEATKLDLRTFDTSKITNMSLMFHGSKATKLDLSSFNTSNVTNMMGMFNNSKATELDLSSFDTSKVIGVTSMSGMFKDCPATIGYARTQADADKLNSSSDRPEGLTFVVKPAN